MKNKIYRQLVLLFLAINLVSCQDFLNQQPDSIFDNDQIFSDEQMIKSVLANFYGRIDWGPNFENLPGYGLLDEACYGSNGGDPTHTTEYDVTLWRVYDYELIRNFNQFLDGVRNTTVLTEEMKLRYEAEVRFLRAWTYFNMIRGLGGVPIVGDKVFSYDAQQAVSELQIPRSTEAESYDYVISECEFAAKYLPDVASENTNASRATSWVALALKARAAIYAASLAKYNNQVTPDIKTAGCEVGIPAELAESYYKKAFAAADTIINSHQYQLYNKESDKAHNFYMAVSSKSDNPEVMWAKDYKYPSHTNNWSISTCPRILSFSSGGNSTTPLLNLVEAYEYVDNRDGHLKTENERGEPIFYDNPGDIFEGKDPRMKGTIICNGDEFGGVTIEYQAGQYYYQRNKWKERKGKPGSLDADGDVLTSINGPQQTSDWTTNKTGFNFRKYLDEDRNAGMDLAHGSEIWFVRFRYAEVLLIAAEACLELGNEQAALGYLNQIRERAGLKGLTTMSLLDIEQERRVEFALENHRWWDLKRWRRAHVVWDGHSAESVHYTLFPYKVKDPRRPENGKWVYVRGESPILLEPRTFQMKNYYNPFDVNWLANNPKLVKNPYQ